MKKYTYLYPPLVERILAEEAARKDPDKAAKTRLHQLYGAYVQPAMYKKAKTILSAAEQAKAEERHSPSHEAESLLRLHASTRERLPHCLDFYRFIFEHVPPPESIVDLGCGFNPFSLPFLYEAGSGIQVKLKTYRAYDICTQQAELINRFFILHNLPPDAECLDLAATPDSESLILSSESLIPNSELVFMFKLLPVLEAQSSGGGFRVVRGLTSKHLVITYPLKSLGGKEKGMARHYRHTFQTAYDAGLLSPFTLIAERQIGTEWVCILSLRHL
ncbi:MAG: hypothetical protein FWD90_11210 [Defluviitaleaceae bacterium]|nr:hypothetical protein [Defluviitaleaceae bacterium]